MLLPLWKSSAICWRRRECLKAQLVLPFTWRTVEQANTMNCSPVEDRCNQPWRRAEFCLCGSPWMWAWLVVRGDSSRLCGKEEESAAQKEIATRERLLPALNWMGSCPINCWSKQLLVVDHNLRSLPVRESLKVIAETVCVKGDRFPLLAAREIAEKNASPRWVESHGEQRDVCIILPWSLKRRADWCGCWLVQLPE